MFGRVRRVARRTARRTARPREMLDERAGKQGTGDDADELRKLAALRDEGILAPEEFEAKKKKILGL